MPRKIIFIIIIFSILLIGLFFWQTQKIKEPEIKFNKNQAKQSKNKSMPPNQLTKAKDLELIIVFDNNQFDQRLKTGWGFSCYIKSPQSDWLFDTGADGQVLLDNMKKLKLDPNSVRQLFLSHIHGDHVGGLTELLAQNSDLSVYLPAVFPENLKNQIKQTNARAVEIGDFKALTDNYYSSGILGTGIEEQALIIETDQGLVVITGCAHPGIIEIIETIKNQLDQPILLVIGGFHLGSAGFDKTKNIVQAFQDLGVKYAAPCHCSGEIARRLFEQEYKENYIEVGVGKSIKINQLNNLKK